MCCGWSFSVVRTIMIAGWWIILLHCGWSFLVVRTIMIFGWWIILLCCGWSFDSCENNYDFWLMNNSVSLWLELFWLLQVVYFSVVKTIKHPYENVGLLQKQFFRTYDSVALQLKLFRWVGNYIIAAHRRWIKIILSSYFFVY